MPEAETGQQITGRLDEMPAVELRVLENRLRRMAARQKMRVIKSKRRDKRAYDYATFALTTESNLVVASGMNLDELEKYLVGDMAVVDEMGKRSIEGFTKSLSIETPAPPARSDQRRRRREQAKAAS
jgi:hypothetical protein